MKAIGKKYHGQPKHKATETARFIIEKSGKSPKIAILTGTGLKDMLRF
jgi:hypothetical protein